MRTTMRTTTAASTLAFSLIVLLASCSSAPGPEEEVTAKRRKATEYSEYGNNYYNQGMYEKALELGGSDEGGPGPRGDSGFYAAYFRDLDGNKLNAFCMVAAE